jgi:hypothetical protein
LLRAAQATKRLLAAGWLLCAVVAWGRQVAFEKQFWWLQLFAVPKQLLFENGTIMKGAKCTLSRIL